jgi:hypothetical protein
MMILNGVSGYFTVAAHKHDVIGVRLFLRARPALRDVAAVVMHTDNRALVQRPKNKFVIAIVRHGFILLRIRIIRVFPWPFDIMLTQH